MLFNYLRWRILPRMRRFFRPTLRRPEPRRLLPMPPSPEFTGEYRNRLGEGKDCVTYKRMGFLSGRRHMRKLFFL